MDNDKLREQLNRELPEANLAVSKPLFFVGIGVLFLWLLFEMKVFHSNMRLVRITLPFTALLLICCGVACRRTSGKGRWHSYIIFQSMLILCFFINLLTGYKTSALFIFPVVLSMRYGKRLITTTVASFATVYLLLCAACEVLFARQIGLVDLNTIKFAGSVTMTVSGTMYDEVLNAAPEAAGMFFSFLKLSTLPNLIALWFSCLAVLLTIQNNEKRTLALMKSVEREKQLEIDLMNTKTKAMMSQIQPHFLYNTISSIMSIDGNPEQTVDALGEFGKYLRENLDTITGSDLIPIEKELQHVERYLSLEKLRFGDNIGYNVSHCAGGFPVPALSVQVLVENAVKHGVTKKKNGGNIQISVEKNEAEYYVTVSDDGVGFETSGSTEAQNNDPHIGLKNLKDRLSTLCGGTLEIESTVGKGTVAIIHIPF